MTRDNADSFTDDSCANIVQLVGDSNITERQKIKDFVMTSLGVHYSERVLVGALYSILTSAQGKRYFKEFFDAIKQMAFITNMRYSDKEIPLTIPTMIDSSRDDDYYEEGQSFARSRALGYAISSMYEQAAVSFRGFTFQVTSVVTSDVLPQLDMEFYNQLRRRVARNRALRRHSFLNPNPERIRVHVPDKIVIDWGHFNNVVCRRCGHVQQANRQGITCINCRGYTTNAPVIIRIPPPHSNTESEIIQISNPSMNSMRWCSRHNAMSFHLRSTSKEDPIGSLKWICALCNTTLTNGECRVCKDMNQRRNSNGI